MLMFWRSVHPDIERYITAFALGDVWARPTLDLKTRSLICLASAVVLERADQVRLHTRERFRTGRRRQRWRDDHPVDDLRRVPGCVAAMEIAIRSLQ